MNLLLYSAGASDASEMQNPPLPTGEMNRYRALGLAILIVSGFAGISMGIALSTWTDTWWVIALGASAFAFSIWCIERILTTGLKGKLAPVSTTDQTSGPLGEVPSSGRIPIGRRLSVGWSILWRFALAGFIGLLVSQPLVALIFSGPIQSQLQSEQRSALGDVRRPLEATLDSLQALQGAAERRFGKRLSSQRERLRCFEELRTAELGGVKLAQCGFTTSGATGNGTKTQALDALITSVREDLAALQARANSRLKQLTTERRSVQDQMGKKVEQRRETFEASLLTQLSALEEISNEEPLIRQAHWLLWATLILLDTLPVLVKVQIGGGPYDRYVAQEDALHAVELEVEGRVRRDRVRRVGKVQRQVEATRMEFEEARLRLLAQMQETLGTITEAGEVLQEGMHYVVQYMHKIDEADAPRSEQFKNKLMALLDELLSSIPSANTPGGSGNAGRTGGQSREHSPTEFSPSGDGASPAV